MTDQDARLQPYRDRADVLFEALMDWHFETGRVLVTAGELWDRVKDHELFVQRHELHNTIRYIVAAWDEHVLRYYDGLGTYRIINLDEYFEPPPDGVLERWVKNYTR